MLLTTLDARGVRAGAPLTWPGARGMFDNAFDLNLERRLKYAGRLALTWRARARLLRELAGLTLGEALFRAQPRAFYPVMSHLIDRRMGVQARVRATLTSLRAVCESVGDEANVRSLLTHGITLLELADHTRIVLSLNDVSFHEGLWQLGLVGADGLRLYSIGFGFTDARTLLMGNVQGPSLKDEGLDRIREATHAAHGMRPPHLLVHALRLLAAHWGATRLLGVDPENHVKGRWNLRDSRLRFDYRAFWAEHEAVRDEGGNWSLPLETALRPLEEVPTKRRAMYRRRYAMLEALQQAVDTLADARHALPPVPVDTPELAAANAPTLEPVLVA
ncbi:MAG TPA: DUF535 family protein [Burkholderiaceae bacterium]